MFEFLLILFFAFILILWSYSIYNRTKNTLDSKLLEIQKEKEDLEDLKEYIEKNYKNGPNN